MQTRDIFLIVSGIWAIDFITTVILLNLGGFYETNPIQRFFYNFGLYGFIFIFILNIFFLYGTSFLAYRISNTQKNPIPYQYFFIFLFGFLEIYAILNNLNLLIYGM